MAKLPLMQTFYDEIFHLMLDLPTGWQVGITDEFPLLLIAPVVNGSPEATLGISRSVLEPPDEAAYDAIIEDTKADQPRVYQDYEHIYDKHWLQDSYPAYLQRFEWNNPEDEQAMVQILAMIWAGGDVLYDIHATTPKTHAERLVPIIEHIITSLEFYVNMP